MKECFPFEKFKNNIDGVLRFINTFKSENVWLMFCIELPENC